MYRILLDSDPIEEGSSNHEEMVSISASELEALRAAAARTTSEISMTSSVSAPSHADDRLRDEEIARWTTKAQQWEQAFKIALKEKELATALAGRPLVQGAAAQLIKLWLDDLQIVDESGSFYVTTRDGRSVPEAVNSWLASTEFAHFTRTSSRGGTSHPGDTRSTLTSTSPPPPKNLGEAVLMKWRETIQGLRQDPDTPIGLGRRRF